MTSNLQVPLLFGLIAASTTLLGLLAVAFFSNWTERYARLFGLVAAGMLCTLIFLHILPEAFASSSDAPTWLALGFFGGLFLNVSIQTWLPDTSKGGLPHEAITPIVAIGLHSFIDGVIYAVTFSVSFSAGLFTALSLIMHEFPEGVIAYAILRRYAVPRNKALFWAFMAAALTTPLGVLVSAPLIHLLDETLIGLLFAFSAGLLLYVATGPLLVPLKDVGPGRGLMALLLGVGVAVLLISLPLSGHSHSGHEHIHHGSSLEHDHPVTQPFKAPS